MSARAAGTDAMVEVREGEGIVIRLCRSSIEYLGMVEQPEEDGAQALDHSDGVSALIIYFFGGYFNDERG